MDAAQLQQRFNAIGGAETDTADLMFGDGMLPGIALNPDATDVIPSKARGDYREKTVHQIIRDGTEDPQDLPASGLINEAFSAHPDVELDQQARFGEILRDHYVITTASAARTQLLFPFHTELAANFAFAGRYKMFSGRILAFFARPGDADGSGFNEPLLERFYDLFNGDEGLSLLDRQVQRIAELKGGDPSKKASSERLLASAGLGDAPVAFPDAHRLVQRDLDTALRLESLGRRDKVNAVLTVLYFHIAVHYWRAAWCSEEQVLAFVRWMARPTGALYAALEAAHDVSPRQSAFRGQLKFRVSSSRGRRISRTDPAASSYAEADQQRLLRLPANLTFLSIMREAARTLGVQTGTAATLLDIACQLDDGRRADLDLVARMIAYHAARSAADEARADLERRALSEPAGVSALRQAIESVNRKQLRRLGRDVTAQVMKRGGKGLVATRGNVGFFELGPELLVLLTKLLAPSERVPYREFLVRLADYGLAPQSRDEADYLANVMRSMQLLEKHSDAGEAMYVSHFL